jgi:hypothetical protein
MGFRWSLESLESGEDIWPTILAVEGIDEARLFKDERVWRTRTRIPESREPYACGREIFTVLLPQSWKYSLVLGHLVGVCCPVNTWGGY